MKQDLRNAFEDQTEPVHPGLRTQLRARLSAGRPRQRGALNAVVPALAVIALIVAIVSAALLFGGRPPAPNIPAGPATDSPAPAATPSAQPSPPPSPSPLASASADPALPPFQCSAQSGGQVPLMPVTPLDVRLGRQAGYDRFVIELDAMVPAWQVSPQASTTFTEDASGRPVTLAGSRGIRVLLRGAGTQSQSWLQDLKGVGTIREARQLGNFEAVFTWGLGVEGTGCFRAFTLTGPDRLVVDVQSP